MTRAFAKVPRSAERCLRQWVITSWNGSWRSILAHEYSLWRTSVRRQDSTHGVRAFLALGTNAVSAHQLLKG